jgi:hypothetical protein
MLNIATFIAYSHLVNEVVFILIYYDGGSQRGSMWPQGYSFCWQMNIIET